MKKHTLMLILIMSIFLFSMVGCNLIGGDSDDYIITANADKSFTLNVGEEVDFTEYFTVKIPIGINGEKIEVTADMLDLSQVDLTKAGTFTVTLNYKGQSFTATFTVVDPNAGGNTGGGNQGGNSGGNNGGNTGGGNQGGNQGGTTPDPADLSAVFAGYDDYDKWNFELSFQMTVGDYLWLATYGNMGLDFSFTYDYEGETYHDYVGVDNDGIYTYYVDNLDGTYTALNEVTDAEEFNYYYVCDYFELINLGDFEFVATESLNGDSGYSALSPQTVGADVLGYDEGVTWKTFNLYVKEDKISKITATADAADESGAIVEYVFTLTFSKYGQINFNLEDLNVSGGNAGSGGDQGGSGGGNQGSTTPAENVYTSVFTSAGLAVGSGQVGYTANPGAGNFDSDGRGVQFSQSNGDATVTSQTSFTGVTKVTVGVSTNQDLGMYVKVKVGSTYLTSDGTYELFVEKRDWTLGPLLVEFVSAEPLDGEVIVELIATASKKSMYLASITVECGEVVSGGGTTGGGTGGSQGGNSNVMPSQSYNPSAFDSSSVQEKMASYEYPCGLPTEGTYNALVIPVQIGNDVITAEDLANLEKAFNGTEADTGWESVRSYYQQSSYGKLNLTFDIASVYTTAHNSDYYESTNLNGADLLIEVLDALDSSIDFSKYDVNNDGCIDAVYLIYSTPVDYVNDSLYWAFVYWSDSENEYDGVYPYTYLFAGIDFMDENVNGKDDSEYVIPGLKVNSATYIHETGHLLDLDDYYDYNPGTGSDDGLGGADMMDSTVGDHNAYSKLMLDWIEAKDVVTSTKTVTIGAFESTGDLIIIPLDFDNSLYSEYLIIDLYTATGLNELHASNSSLYSGAEYGVRIYHVSSWVTNPFNNDYGSFTDNNNSISTNPLIKLVQADGGRAFESYDDLGLSDSYALDDDLWQEGDVFSTIQSGYTRHDGKALSFDITIDSVSATGATITITYAE